MYLWLNQFWDASFNIWHQSAGQSVPPWARIWGSAVIFRRGSASKQVWETVAWRISEHYCEITIERKFVLKSNWLSTDVLQQSLEETLNRCCQTYFLTYRYNNTKHVRRPLRTKVFSQGEIFRSRPDRPWGPPSLQYSGYCVFPGGKAAGAWRWPPPSGAEVKDRL